MAKLCVVSIFQFLALALVFSTVAAPAQTVSGIVTAAQNAPVANAESSLVSQNTVVARGLTDSEGKFSLAFNNEKDLILRVSAAGFETFERRLANADFAAPLAVRLQPENLRAEVTVFITRTESRLSETPASVVVLKRENLETTAAQTVDDALRQVAGFQLFRRASSRTANPTAQGANFRGLAGSGASRAAIQLDNISINDAFGGWTYWSRVPRAAIEQIETLRGGASAFYGNAALSGAVNILTAKADKDAPVLRFETSAGTQKTFDGSFFAGFEKNKWIFSFAGESFQTAGYVPVAENERGAADARANSRHNSAIFTIERKFTENIRAFARGNLFAERRANGTQLQYNRTYFRQIAAGADFENQTFGAFDLRAFLEAQIYDQSFSAVSLERNAENLTRLQRVPSEASGAHLFWNRAFQKHAIAASLETRRVRGASDETIFAANRAASLVGAGGRETSFSIFAQDVWRAGSKLILNFGGRFDSWRYGRAFSATRSLTASSQRANVTIFPDRREQRFSPRAAALFVVGENFSIFAAASQSFRAPTLNELYRAFRVGNVLTQANENLRAELAANAEAGANFAGFARRLNLRGNVFYTRISRPVVSVTLSETPALITRQRQNLGATRARGVELDADFVWRRDLNLSFGYLFTDSRVADFPANPALVGNFLPQVARQQFSFQAFYRPALRFSGGVQGRISGAQFEDDQNSLRLRPFFTLDALAAYRIKKGVEIFAAVENIFNVRYDIGLTPNLTIAAPRFARIGLRLNFGKN
jgi:outer membrane receptor protein involved in Fe transport